jgi:hypothetical protein
MSPNFTTSMCQNHSQEGLESECKVTFKKMRFKKLENKLVQLEQQTILLNTSKPVSTDRLSTHIHIHVLAFLRIEDFLHCLGENISPNTLAKINTDT